MTNPYIVMLRAALDSVPELEPRTFSWRRALLGRYDVFHAHWPEILVAGNGPSKSLLRQVLFTLLVARLALTRTPVVRTVHNLGEPGGLTRVQAGLLRAFDRRTVLRILLNPTTRLPPEQEAVTILHGHYRDWFAPYARPPAVPGRIGYFGRIRRYKRVESLLEAFVQTPQDWSLRVDGYPSDPDIESRVIALAARDARISLQLGYLDDRELVELVGESEFVVLPYAQMHNSGAVLAALSIGRPVLVPANEVNAQLATEVGPGWVLQYAGALATRHLEEAMTAVRRQSRTPEPDLTARTWAGVGPEHLLAYQRAIAIRRPWPGR